LESTVSARHGRSARPVSRNWNPWSPRWPRRSPAWAATRP